MKISGQQVQRMLQAYAAEKVKQTAPPHGDQARIASDPQDKVEFSELAQQLSRLRNEAQEPLIRQELVDSIRKRLAEGTYNVDAKSIAEQMIKRSLTDQIVGEEGE